MKTFFDKLLTYFLWSVGILLGLGILIVLIVPAPKLTPEQQAAKSQAEKLAIEQKIQADTKELQEKAKKEMFKNRIAQLPLTIDYTWKLGGFGNVLIVSGKIKNHPNSVVWADPTIRCEAFGGSGKKIGEVEKTVYQVIPVGGELELKDFSIGFVNSQTERTRCSVNGRAVEP